MLRALCVWAAAAALLCTAVCGRADTGKAGQKPAASYGSLPIAFEPNVGQTDPSVGFLARGSGYAVFLRPTDATISLVRHRLPARHGEKMRFDAAAFRMKLIGADDAVRGVGQDPLPGKVNHLIGNDRSKWHTGIETFRSARFPGVYPNVDVLYYGTNRSLQYDFIVRPGGEPGSVRLSFEGAEAVAKLDTGDLSVTAGEAEIRFAKPVAYQEAGAARTPVTAAWTVTEDEHKLPVASFTVGDYDRSKPLVIDPLLWYSTYLGGAMNEDCLDIDVHPVGDAFVTGATASPNFPVTPGVLQPFFAGGNMDAFVTKFDVPGLWTMYSTYLGSQTDEVGFSIRVDLNGHAHVCGFTDNAGFPVTPGCFDPLFNGQRDCFASILDPVGATLVYSTFIGGGGNDEAREIRLTARVPCFAIAGASDSQNYPVTLNSFDPGYNGGIDAVYTEIRPLGQGAGDLVYSTYIGSEGNELALCMDTDPMGRAHIGGFVDSPWFPISFAPFQPVYAGNIDGFVFTLNPVGLGPADMVYSSYIGGKDTDEVRGIVWDNNMGMFTVTGMTKSPDFPIIPGAMQPFNAGGVDAFVSTVRPVNGGPPDLFVSTYLGGAGDDFGNDIDMDNTEPFVVGTTASQNFPVTPGCIQGFLNGPSDAFVARCLPLLNALIYCTYWGGEATEEGWGIRLDGDANAYICGTTGSQAFPVTLPCFDPAANGGNDGWVTKLGIGRATDTTVNASAGRIGDTVPLQARLTYCVDGSPVVGKQMDFYVDGVSVGSANTDATGWATLNYPIPEGAGAGARTILAQWLGDATAGASQNTNTLTVNKAPTSINVPNRTGTITELVELRGYLRRTTDGAWVVGRTVTFDIDGTVVGTGVTDAGGKATYNWVITAGAGSRTIGGTFAGDVAYDPCTGSGTLTCQTWTTKMATFNRTARITDTTELKCRLLRSDNVPLYNKNIDFYVDGTFVITRPTDVNGYASYPFYVVPDGAGAGTRTILSDWVGNAGYAACNKTATLTVLKAIPYIWVLSKRVPVGGIANLYAYFRRLYDYQKQVGKTVDFKIAGTVVQTLNTDTNGVARYYYYTTEPVGTYQIRCEFYGDAWLDPGYGDGTLTIY